MTSNETTFERLAEIIGKKGALNLCEHYGGLTLYVRKGGDLPEGTAKHWAEHFGPEAYSRIAEQFGGVRVYIPILPGDVLADRNAAIYRARKEGVSTEQLAADYLLSPRAINGIVSRLAQSIQLATNQGKGV